MMQLTNSPQYTNSQNGFPAMSSQQVWSPVQQRLGGSGQGGVPVATRQHTWSQAQSQPENSIHMNANAAQMHNPNFMAIRADLMTVEQTAAWIGTLGYQKGWEEATEYENSFRGNQIKGYMLQSLTHDSLKSDLGIWKYGHRLEIMMAIKGLFPSMGKMILNKMQNTVVNSPLVSQMVFPCVGSENVGSPMSTFCSPIMTFGTPQNGHQPVGMGYSQIVQSDMNGTACWSPININQHRTDNVKDVGHGNVQGSPTMSEQPSGELYSLDCKFLRSSYGGKEIPLDSKSNQHGRYDKKVNDKKRKCKRAGPTNPVEYLTLCQVQVRAGKSGNANVTGELEAGQIVVINQIKGRSGRIVEERKNGEYVKKGWVTLHRSRGRQLLVKCNATMKEWLNDSKDRLNMRTPTSE